MKYIIHYHLTAINHYDLMLEKNNTLLTWQIPQNLFLNFLAEKKIKIKQIKNHRLKYLTHQGFIRTGQGFLEKYDEGKYQIKSWTDQKKIITITGKKIKGQITIEQKTIKYEKSTLQA